MDNISDFYNQKIFFFMPRDDCPRTYFFKPRYPKTNNNSFNFKEKNITLISFDDEESTPTYFSEGISEFRKIYFEKLGFKLYQKMNSFNIYLTPYTINAKFQNELNNYVKDKYQKINKFYNYEEYVSKSLLYKNYKIFKDKFPADFNYMLETYSYPEDKKSIELKFKNYTFNENITNDLWLIKPTLGSLGSKIKLFTNLSSITMPDYLITKYLNNPHLIRQYKYDLRFHGLVSTIKPLKLYLYNEGMLRLATEKFTFSISDLQNKYALLTNIFINRQNKDKYIYPQNISNIEDSNLWNFETFGKYCENNNIDFNKIYSEVSDIFIKMILTVREKLINEIDKNNLKYSNFYHLIGFDIILDNNLKPYLLEANRRCSFRDDNDAEKYYSYNILADTLNIIGIRKYNCNNLNNKNNKTEENIKEIIEESLCELDRPRGGYKLIFPLKNNVEKYKKFFENNITKEDNELWKLLIE